MPEPVAIPKVTLPAASNYHSLSATSRDHTNSQVSSNGQIANNCVTKSVPQIRPRVFRIRRHGNLGYKLGTSRMGNRAFTAQPVISPERRASRLFTGSARDCCLRRRRGSRGGMKVPALRVSMRPLGDDSLALQRLPSAV
jgi:hypothetical protein